MKSIAKVTLCGMGLSLVLSACGDSSNDDGFSPAGPVIGELSSDSGVGPDVGLSSAGTAVPGASSAIVGGSSAAIPGVSSPVQPTSSAGTAVPGSSAAVPPASSAATVIPRFEGNSPVFFSEVSPSNANFKDNDGNDPGWVEFYNSSDTPVSLKGFALTNDLTDPRRWVFGNATVPAKSYMIVFLSGKSYADYILPSDSLNLMGSDCSSESAAGGMGGMNFPGMGNWGGNPGGAGGNTSGNNVENLPGKSSLCFSEGGSAQMGAVMKVAQGGNYSRVVIKANGTNLGKINQLVVRGFITKNHKIRVNFKEGDSLSNWGGKNLRGTGDIS